MEQRLIQTHSQQLILSPQLRQYLKLLQLPLLDLQLSIEEELAQNPVLEEEATNAEKEAGDEQLENDAAVNERELEFDKTLDQLGSLDDDMRETLYHSSDFSGESVIDAIKKHDYQESILTSQPTLANYLEWQLNLHNLTEDEKRIAVEIIGNINDDGYFVSTIEEIATSTKTPADQVEKILKVIQTFDPPGVGGRNLSEVLLIELKRNQSGTLAQKIVEHHLPLLQRKQLDSLAAVLSTTPEQISHACQVISRLEPKPGRIFYQNKTISVVPDIMINRSESEKDGETEYVIEINHEIIPELRINQKYRKMLKQKNIDAKTKAFLREKIQAALLFVRALAERKSTLRQIADELIKIQKDFLDRGFSYLKPLRMRDIAEKLGIHESTISRAINGKYVSCPQGTIPLKNFFSSGMAMDDGVMESQKSVIEKVRRLIDSENKEKPYSDAHIASLLKTEGVTIARRTVTKYRELLRVLPTHLRKVK